jgi:Na+/H+-translocating membrane pyrophosphatase
MVIFSRTLKSKNLGYPSHQHSKYSSRLKTIPTAVMGSVTLAGLFFTSMAYIEMLGFSGTGVSMVFSPLIS